MGEVYRARDTRLDRTVAIKILPAHLSSNAEAKQRFDREARAISSLSHPNICALYDVGHQDGIDYLVMEFLEGETLADRLARGLLPPEQVLKYGIEICEGLEKAHRGGITHRDLKPGNVMLTKTGAKLMDFGLAKPSSESGATASGLTLTSPVASRPLTQQGMIVGTFQYMSPEQIEGKEADARSDIFALGAVLYEMATGKRAFEGKSTTSVIVAILERNPPPISTVQPMFPRALDSVVKTCLAKDPDERWQSIRDLRTNLEWIGAGESPVTSSKVEHKPWRERAAWLLAATFVLLGLAGGAAWWQASYKRPLPMYFHTSVPFAANDLALSPDSHTLAMVAYSAQAGNNVLWTYEVGSRRSNSLDGTQGASYPFWSPDGRFIGFFADGKLKKVEVSGGQPQMLCDAPNGRGGAWNRDGMIVFSPDSLGTGLFRVSSVGGSPVEITKLDTTRSEESHRWPVFLPDGRHFLYLGANFSGELDKNAIFLGSLDSQERRLLVRTSANAAYAEPGYMLYMRDNKTLVAQPFDRRSYVLSGEPRTLSDEVLYMSLVDRAVFGVSDGDVLVTQTGKGAFLSQLTWFDRNGKRTGTVGLPGSYNNVRLSTDGSRIATDQTDPDGRNTDIWIHELARGATTRLTFDPSFHTASIWSPDGRQVLFGSNRQLGFKLQMKNADGSGPEEEVADLGAETQINAWDWSRDGKYILVRKTNELWYLTWPERVAKPLLQAKWTVRNVQFSPDGRWMAYASNETGRMEIYVSPFLSGNGKWQVSSAGGQEPKWRQDGRELFYLSPDEKMMAVAVTTDASFKAGSPVALFQTHRRQPVSAQDVFSYDVSGDGQRFLINTKVDEANAAPLSVLLNWVSEMEK